MLMIFAVLLCYAMLAVAKERPLKFRPEGHSKPDLCDALNNKLFRVIFIEVFIYQIQNS